jgi:hypothetical protein
VTDIVLDTSAPATDAIDYVATDTWGNTATATRSVIIDVAAAARCLRGTVIISQLRSFSPLDAGTFVAFAHCSNPVGQ